MVDWLRSILVAFGLFLVIRAFLVEAFRIPTGSMEDTLLVGDFLLVNKAIYGGRIPLTDVRLPAFSEPRVGQMAVFVPPHVPGQNYVKRIVAAGGDTVAMRHKTLYLNGAPVDEPYVRHTHPDDVYTPGMTWQCAHAPDPPGNADCRPTRDNWGPLVVPAGSFMMLGDNRDDSEDSRYWGLIQRQAIKGTPLFVYFSFDPAAPDPLPWLTEIRWQRIGRTVH
jgi:signal peptidase I